jgi:hypothetical protein
MIVTTAKKMCVGSGNDQATAKTTKQGKTDFIVS